MQPETIAWAYPLAFWTHIALVIASVSLFAMRGLGVLAGQIWPMCQIWRGLSVWIDVGLLSAGGTLWFMLQFNPWHDHWLGAKLILLVVYILLGSMALKRAPTRAAKALFFAAALLCVAFMASIALHHSPLGWWA
ncbi:hypothetical protein LPB72_21535 [Hydrogenophaga crassostreae]|uniref:Regulator SirB n=1 Tax=Hydrogenophaga crassostreae TaxID=1763535 RepID=A0A162YR15_9BURK|nr:SirB2 family protein [Hydrogenophaga crassostreae]AOW15106.1 hypothetical protein LPB072_22150 [Hydrogenophaga crassostreae]OAD39560.1 hypothetical protein LPB72_21535 [Hydrogenophaga crassostreae]